MKSPIGEEAMNKHGTSLLAGIGLLLIASLPIELSAQLSKPQVAPTVPRLADGRPDLQGTYDLNTLTPVDRPRDMPAVLTPEAAAALEDAVTEDLSASEQALAGDRSAPPAGGDGSTGAAGNVGGYNTFWLDPARSYMMVNGEIRTSLIVDPPNGRMPPLTAEGLARLTALTNAAIPDQPPADDPGLGNPESYNDPEQRPLGERCLLGFGSTSGPPALPNYFYNNLHQIVQTPDHVMILSEMVHDARVVRMNADHRPPHMTYWMGDSVGHWEGDTLVVDTTNFNDKTRFRGSGDGLHVVERFTRVDANNLLYQFTIEDPATWASAWSGEYIWPQTDDPIYEYACHENNYALEGVLRGARYRESEAGVRGHGVRGH
jgi:hypothetical protein